MSSADAGGDSARRLADRLGICLSALCLLHCLLMPVLILLLPSLQWLESEGSGLHHLHEDFHIALLLVLPVVAVLAFVPGYRRHGDKRVFAWAFPGLMIIALVALFFEHISWVGSFVSVLGSLMLIRAHQINRKLCACCEAGHGKSAFSKKKWLKQDIVSLRLAELRSPVDRRHKLLTTPRRR